MRTRLAICLAPATPLSSLLSIMLEPKPPHPTDAMAYLRELEALLGRDAVRDVVSIFLSDLPARLASLQDSSGNMEELRRAAHQLRGGAGSLGLGPLVTACLRLEEIAQSGNAAEAVAQLDEVLRLCAESAEALRRHLGI